jgi:hypothetical protein
MMKKQRYLFYLNPFEEYKWTRCPNCNAKTKLRKYCLVIAFGEKSKSGTTFLTLNKSCKFCPECELVIASKFEIESHLYQLCAESGRHYVADDFFIFGTMDRKDWLQQQQKPTDFDAFEKAIHPFVDALEFEVKPGGWYLESEK